MRSCFGRVQISITITQTRENSQTMKHAWNEEIRFDSVMTSRLTWFFLNSLRRCLLLTPKHKQDDKENLYVALSLMISKGDLEQGQTMHAVFELSIFNNSNGMYCGYKGRLVNVFFQVHPSYFPPHTKSRPILLAMTLYIVLVHHKFEL